ncbi:MAG: GDSL-type esterase/lipase family protein [Planctomycetota bacterium]
MIFPSCLARETSFFVKMLIFLILATSTAVTYVDAQEEARSKSQWQGFERADFEVEGRKAWLVKPDRPAEGKPWIWRARFFGHEPQTDIALLQAGYHLAYCDVGGLFGSPTAVQHWNAFYEKVVREHELAQRVALEGMSRGGLIIYNWAAENPGKVACIYADAPVCTVSSWPQGSGVGKGSAGAWKQCMAAYAAAGVKEPSEIQGPLDRLDTLAKADVPLLHIVGDADEVVPVSENTAVLEQKYKALGGTIEVIHKPSVGHHPHSLTEPGPIVRFVRQHCENNIVLRDGLANSAGVFEKEAKGTVAFIGGSITQMNGYRPMVCENLQKRFPKAKFNFINAGISSTCSTTGACRLQEQVFHQGRVDMLFVEFAVNDDQDAAHSRQNCIRGLEGILHQALAHNPNMDIVVTFFVNTKMLESLQRGHTPLSIAAHQRVIEHYEVSSIHLAKEIAERISDEKLTWAQYGGVHPKPLGNRICANMIQQLCNESWDTENSETKPHALPAQLLDRTSYANARLLPLTEAQLESGWRIEVPAWKELAGSKREQFTKLEMLCADSAGATMHIEFTGRALGAYVLAGPDAGVLEVSIDGHAFQDFNLLHRHSKRLHYPRTVMFQSDLPPGKHKATIRLKQAANAGAAQSAARILRLVAN